MGDSSVTLEGLICFRLYKYSRRLIRLYQPFLDSMRITYPQFITMLVMWEEGEIDFKELGTRLDLSTGTLTPITKRLEDLGYLERIKNLEDRRRIWLRITEEGRALEREAEKVLPMMKSYVHIDAEQYKRYSRVLDELGEILKQAENTGKEKTANR